MQRHTRALFIAFTLAILASAFSPLFAWRGFYSDLPSMRFIEKADSLTGFDITKYTIHLKIDDDTRFIEGKVIAEVRATLDLQSIAYELEGDELNVNEVKVNGVPATFSHENGIIAIPLSMAQGENFSTEISYSGHPSNSPAPYNIGLIFRDTAIYTLSNPDAGRYYWPCYDHPWDKALVEWYITVREDWLAAANGTRLEIIDNNDGTRTHHWLLNSPVATYVIGFAAGPYIEWWQDADGIPIQNFVLPTQLSKAQEDFADTPQMIAFFSELFGDYPFEKYGHVVVPMTTYAAMEHQTMTTFGARYLTGDQQYESIVAHELAHQWYGNYLTPITMREVWLKESFATYSEFLWEHHKKGWDEALRYLATSIQGRYLSWQSSNGPHTIFNPEYNQMFAPPTYEKSASVLHMLRLKMGNEAFFTFIRALLTTYPNANINTAEFIALAESHSNQDLTQFFKQWIFSPGIPDLSYIIFHDKDAEAKVYAKSSSDTATDFWLDLQINVPNSAGADSLMIVAAPDWQPNYFQIEASGFLEGLEVDANHWLLTKTKREETLRLSSCLAYSNTVDLLWEELELGIDLAGYNIYRRAIPEGLFQQINDAPVLGNTFLDTNLQNGLEYEYYITALDTELFESLGSNRLIAKTLEFPFDQGILVVNETRAGNGTPFSPTHAEVNAFYSGILEGINYQVWNIDYEGQPALADLARHPFIFWHSDDYIDIQILELQDIIASYILSGGKMIISGWKYPAVFSESFLKRFLPDIQPNIINSAKLSALHSPEYPSLYPDPAKLVSPWQGRFPMSCVFAGAENALYYAELFETPDLDNEAVVIHQKTGGELVLSGVPLYFMQNEGVKGFLPALMEKMLGESAAEKPKLRLFPNPLPAGQELIFSCGDFETKTVELYNIRGQKLLTLNDLPYEVGARGRKYRVPALALQGFQRGLYILKVKSAGKSVTGKFVM